jgi:integral membrane sensor domain MASE1
MCEKGKTFVHNLTEESEFACNRPWVMQLRRAHVSFITGLTYYCTRLGLSSTASLIVSYPFIYITSP